MDIEAGKTRKASHLEALIPPLLPSAANIKIIGINAAPAATVTFTTATIANGGMFGAAFIEQDLRAADAAVMSGDVVAMLQAFETLKQIEA